MNSRTIRLFALCFCLSIIIDQIPAGAHSGGLDSNGGHYNRKTGEYHSHRKPSAVQEPIASAKSAEIHERVAPKTQESKITILLSAPERERRINEYFRNANENVGALDCNIVIYARDISELTKQHIKRDHGNKCIICESTVKLEIDHRRALMNGGTNNAGNLELLCDDCHKIKTKYDNSLRRKRESVCRKK